MNPDSSHTRVALERAAALVAAAADTADPDLGAKVEAELNAALADVESGSIDLDELVSSLTAIAGYAIDEAARLRSGGAAARDVEREAVLRASVAALKPWEAEQPAELAASDLYRERQRDQDRRAGERRHYAADSPPARVSRWLYGERRSGFDRRSGVDRRANPPTDGEG
jgi:hypothetical protein